MQNESADSKCETISTSASKSERCVDVENNIVHNKIADSSYI